MVKAAASVLIGSVFLATAAWGAAMPGYAVTPLTKADVDFYMDIMRAAAAHNAHLTGDDKAAVDFTIDMQKHPPKEPKGMPTQAEIATMTRNATLAARATSRCRCTTSAIPMAPSFAQSPEISCSRPAPTNSRAVTQPVISTCR